MKPLRLLPVIATFAGLSFNLPAMAAETFVAVAANFTAAGKDIAAAFEKQTGDTAILSFGSTGQLHAQILNGAPFEVFVAADAKHPAALERDGHIGAQTRFTYAVGKLTLWSPKSGVVDTEGAVLSNGALGKFAVANPKTAPTARRPWKRSRTSD